ncbi:MAG: N-acetylmuramoyl-L-alanine amidase [Peptococcaceae bacterium]|nr:N-acetylmuramoyl-L-alanine amidase [Peptococcaceae bacterium]
MSSRKQPRITNIWSKVVENGAGDLFSMVVIESTGIFQYRAESREGAVVLEASGAVANMPEGVIEVNDGLVREISLRQAGPDVALVEIRLEHPAGYGVEVAEGIPVRTAVTLERGFLLRLFQGKKIVVDPGHGGEDLGGRGPVNLLEKNVVVPIAGNLGKMFEQVGATVLLTRTGDQDIPLESRIKAARKAQADLFVSIHTHSDRDSRVGGVAVLYGPSSPAGRVVADLVREALIKKLKLADRGNGESRDYAALQGMPAIEVEVVTITNWVEEGLLRSPTVHKKAAEGIFNGVKNFFAGAALK